eukprot:8135894-Pyramimonas_sp.AAC.1
MEARRESGSGKVGRARGRGPPLGRAVLERWKLERARTLKPFRTFGDFFGSGLLGPSWGSSCGPPGA